MPNKKTKKLFKMLKLDGPGYRSAQFERATIDLEQRTVELSFSSEEPYARWWGIEILGHDANEVRLGRMNDGGAFLMDHNTRDQVGVVEKAWVGQDRKGRALVRFGKSVRAAEIFQDVIDEIRRNVSVSYDLHKMLLLKSEIIDGGKDTIDTYRVTDWEPLEISLVSVPADVTVGVGRSQAGGAREVQIEIPNKEEKKNMKKCMKCGFEYEGEVCPVCARADALSRETQTRVNDILAIGKKHNLQDEAHRFIAEGKSVAEFKDFVIDKISTPDRNIDTGERSDVSIPDQPIYKGSNASMLGQQLKDIRTMSKPEAFEEREIRESRSRLEQSQKRHMQKLVTLAEKEGRAAASGGFTVGVPSDGGFFLQGETVVDLMTNGFNNSEILPRTAKRTLTATQFVEIFGIDETSRRTGSRGGGIRVYTNKELGEFTVSKSQFSMIRVEPKKLTGLFYASGEWMRNVTFLGQEVRGLFGEEFAFKCQDLSIRGSGAGEAKGILNSGCLVSVAKETNQIGGTINTKNLSKMWSRFQGRNPVWFINRDVNPQLDELSITAGTGALEPRFVTYDAQGTMRIKGVPVIAIEQCETVGTVGDIILADWSQYVTADQGDVNEAMSIHVNFTYDQDTYRFIYYFDGQSRWSSAVTPFKGSNTVSPFVVLATRS